MKFLIILIIMILFSFYFVSASLELNGAKGFDLIIPGYYVSFYGNLTGVPSTYDISPNSGLLDIQLLLPDLPNPDFKAFAVITQNNQVISILDGSTYNWTICHDYSTGDDYWIGPNATVDSSHNLTISITNSNNIGKYILRIHDGTSNPIIDTLLLWSELPQLKEYMDKSPIQAYNNKAGEYFYLTLIAISVLIAVILLIVLKKRI